MAAADERDHDDNNVEAKRYDHDQSSGSLKQLSKLKNKQKQTKKTKTNCASTFIVGYK